MGRSTTSSDLQTELSRLDAHAAARRLLGCELIRTIEGHSLIGRIVETESYEETDRAAHSYGGPRGRNLVMYGPAGFAYVYFTYGMHYCFNIVVGPVGKGEAVLIRAIEPLVGTEIMQLNRAEKLAQITQQGAVSNGRVADFVGKQSVALRNLCNGPAKLTQAMAIGPKLNSHDLSQPPLQLVLRPPLPDPAITTTTRIGIRHNIEHLQRFYITGNLWISKA